MHNYMAPFESIRSIMFKRFFGWMFTLFCGSVAYAGTEPMKILFIGNSYTHMNDMPGIFDRISKKAGQTVLVEKSTHSGFSFREHSERVDMYEAINKRSWDYVVLQGFSRELIHTPEHIDKETIPYLKQIIDSIYANNPCTNILFYMTWGYDNGYGEREEVNTYDKMADTIQRGYEYIGNYFDVPVVPVGMIWKEVRNSTLIDLYAEDRAHPSKNGSYLAAATFYGAIFDEYLNTIYTSTISEQAAREIKKRMEKYIAENRSALRLHENKFIVKTSTSKRGEFILDYSAYYPKAVRIEWSFGNGSQETGSNGRYIYNEPGDYVLELNVYDTCGVRSIKRNIHFDEIKKPQRKKRSKPRVKKSTNRLI